MVNFMRYKQTADYGDGAAARVCRSPAVRPTTGMRDRGVGGDRGGRGYFGDVVGPDGGPDGLAPDGDRPVPTRRSFIGDGRPA